MCFFRKELIQFLTYRVKSKDASGPHYQLTLGGSYFTYIMYYRRHLNRGVETRLYRVKRL